MNHEPTLYIRTTTYESDSDTIYIATSAVVNDNCLELRVKRTSSSETDAMQFIQFMLDIGVTIKPIISPVDR